MIRKSFVEGGELDVGADGCAGYGQAEESANNKNTNVGLP